MIKPLLISLAILLILPNFAFVQQNEVTPIYNGKEKFSAQLSFINSVDALEKFVDAAAFSKKIPFQSLEYAELLDNSIAYRFYNSSARKTLQQDWIAVLSDKIFSTSLSVITQPEDIMRQPNAGASQQNTIFSAILKRKKISFRNIRQHEVAAMQVSIGGRWYFFDVANEPALKGNERLCKTGLFAPDKLMQEYKSTPGAASGPDILQKSEINAMPPGGAISFSILSNILSKTLWVVCVLMVWFFRKKPFRMHAIIPKGKYVRMFPMQPSFNA